MDARARSAAQHRGAIVVAFAAALAGGALAWALVWFTNVGLVSLAIGAALTFAAVGIGATNTRHVAPLLAGYAFGFVIVTWPLLYVVVGLIRYLITGKALGD
jgi:hypothetical protein